MPVPGRALVTVAVACLLAALGFALAGAVTPARSASTPLSIAISGNHFVNGAGQTVQLVGADVPSTEYACDQGWGYSSAADDNDDSMVAANIRAWGANVVRVPLNEDCWLGLNSEPNTSQGDPLTVAGYQAEIEKLVGDLNADGIYAILDLHWSGPGSQDANGQEPMPDDHSSAFWTSVAGAFKTNPSVIFDLFNEPYSPAYNGATGTVTWSCWLDGNCAIADYNDDAVTNSTYTAVGMEPLIHAIRGTGAAQPIMVGGLQFAEDLSGWLANEPTDTLSTPQIAASFHNYEDDGICDDVSCWNSTIAPVAAQVPVVTGEVGENSVSGSGGTCSADSANFDGSYMDWADQKGVSYLGWGWFLDINNTCDGGYYLLDSDGTTPATPNGVALHDHLESLDAPAGLTTTTPTPTTTSGPNPTSSATTSTTTPSTSSTSAPSTTTPSSSATTAASSTTTRTPAAVAATCKVPRVVGDTLANARRRITAAHCSVGKITRPKSAREFTVASINPKAGKREHNGAKVSITLRIVRRR